MPVGQPEFVDNPEPRCPVVLLLDTSQSMIEGQAIQELNQGIEIFQRTVQNDQIASLRVEVAIIVFGGEEAKTIQDFRTIDDFITPSLKAGGRTPMGSALNLAMDLLEDRKTLYRDNGIQYYQPWVFMITDGAPTDSWQQAAQRLRQAEEARKLSFFAVAVQGADMKTLKEIAPITRPPLLLNGLNFKDLFIWLSQSMSRVSSSSIDDHMTDLPPVSWGRVPL